MTFDEIKSQVEDSGAILVAVSKTHPVEKIQTFYDQGQLDFGENKVQEMIDKVEALPDTIRWHMIGHLQTNKVKYLAPFVHLIHSLDRISLAKEINKEGRKINRVISVLLQIKIAEEESKFGIDPNEIDVFMANFLKNEFDNIRLIGVMGMATFTDDEKVIKKEFQKLELIYTELKNKYFEGDPVFITKSYGMSSDYQIALETGSNMVRIGSLIFGERNY